MAFTSTTTLKARLAGMLKISDPDDLAAYWTDIVSDSLTAAYNEIRSALARRGYNTTQIAAWDRGSEFETDLGLFWCLTKGAGLGAPDGRWIEKLDRREELKTVDVTIDGEMVTPAGRPQINFGPLVDDTQTFKRQVTVNGELDEVKW